MQATPHQAKLRAEGFRWLLLAVLVAGSAAIALAGDSLGGFLWTSYLRSDAADTASGRLFFPAGATIGEWGGGEFKAPYCTQLDAFNQTGYFGEWGMNGDGLLINCQNAALPSGNAGVTFSVSGDGAKGAMFQFDNSHPNEFTNLIFLTGNSVVSAGANPTEMIRIGEIPVGGQGIGSYITSPDPTKKCRGYYNDVGVNAIGVLNETNNTTRPGDVGQYNLLDYTNGGRGTPMLFYDYGSEGTWPMIVLTGDDQNYLDSSMIYRWGMLADSFRARHSFSGRTAEVETVKTALCGLRAFGNGGANLCDTIAVPGVAGGTTVVTASYAGGFDAISCTALRVKVLDDAIIVKRGAVTDPDSFYWQATKSMTRVLTSGVPQGAAGAHAPAAPLALAAAPNPSAGRTSITYGLPSPGRARLTVYNLLGQKLSTVLDQWQPAGRHTVCWNGRTDDGRDLAAGLYLYQLSSPSGQLTRKLILVK